MRSVVLLVLALLCASVCHAQVDAYGDAPMDEYHDSGYVPSYPTDNFNLPQDRVKQELAYIAKTQPDRASRIAETMNMDAGAYGNDGSPNQRPEDNQDQGGENYYDGRDASPGQQQQGQEEYPRFREELGDQRAELDEYQPFSSSGSSGSSMSSGSESSGSSSMSSSSMGSSISPSSSSSSGSGSSSGDGSSSSSHSGSSSSSSHSSESSLSESSHSSSSSGSSSSGSESSSSESNSPFESVENLPAPPKPKKKKHVTEDEEEKEENLDAVIQANMHVSGDDDEEEKKDRELERGLQSAKDQLVEKMNIIKSNKKWVKDATKVVKMYVNKIKAVNGDVRQKQLEVKHIFRAKRQIENMQIQRKLERKLSVATKDLWTLHSALKNVEKKQKLFKQSGSEIRTTIGAIQTELDKLRGAAPDVEKKFELREDSDCIECKPNDDDVIAIDHTADIKSQ